METEALDRVAAELRLDIEETLVLTVMQQLMLGRDLIAETNPSRAAVKLRFRNAFADAAVAGHWSRTADLPTWAREPAAAIATRVPAQQRPAVEAAAAEFGARTERRSRALLVLIELHSFQPWPGATGWVSKARRDALAVAALHLTALHPGDLDAVVAEYAAVGRALRRARVRWGRVAAVSATGLVLGVATAGAATPAIAAAVGATLGLSGAAATSAGLAALGGGSLAAGGFGMAGGSALLAGLGALGGAGVAAAGSHLTGWSGAQVVADAVKLGVVTKLVVLGAQDDDEKARRVVEGLQARLDEVTATIARLAVRLRELSGENERLRARLQAEQDDAQLAGTALQVVIDRLPVGA